MPEFAAAEKYFGRIVAPTIAASWHFSAFPPPKLLLALFSPLLPIPGPGCPYLLFLLGQCTLVAETGHHLPFPPLPLTQAAFPPTSPGQASVPSYLHGEAGAGTQLATGGKLLLIGHRSPLDSPPSPPGIINPTLPSSPLGQRWCHMWPHGPLSRHYSADCYLPTPAHLSPP